MDKTGELAEDETTDEELDEEDDDEFIDDVDDVIKPIEFGACCCFVFDLV